MTNPVTGHECREPNNRTFPCGHTPEDCNCDPTPEQEAEAAREEAYWDGDSSGCHLCGGAGFVVTCCDDICRAQGWCMHGDGDGDCPVCNADGDNEWANYGA